MKKPTQTVHSIHEPAGKLFRQLAYLLGAYQAKQDYLAGNSRQQDDKDSPADLNQSMSTEMLPYSFDVSEAPKAANAAECVESHTGTFSTT